MRFHPFVLIIPHHKHAYSDMNPTTGRYIQLWGESIGYFKDRIQVNGSCTSWRGVKKPGWWAKAYARCWDRDGCDVPNSANKDCSIFTVELGAQKAIGSHLVRIDDEHFRCRWVPQLPHTIGKTRDQVQKEAEAEATPHAKGEKRQISKDFVWVSPMAI
jgi:hypothetical protein